MLATTVLTEVSGPDGDGDGGGGGFGDGVVLGVTVVDNVGETVLYVLPPPFVAVAVTEVVTTTVANWSQ